MPVIDVARAYARLRDVDAMIEWLARAMHERNRFVLELPVDPLFKPFRSNPRFVSIITALPIGQVGRTRPASASKDILEI